MTGEASPPKIAVRGVAKRFRGDGTREVVALEAVDLTIAPGEFLALLGPSGCGKTTLLRMLAGLETPSAGSVAIDGVSLATPERYTTPPEPRFYLRMKAAQSDEKGKRGTKVASLLVSVWRSAS